MASHGLLASLPESLQTRGWEGSTRDALLVAASWAACAALGRESEALTRALGARPSVYSARDVLREASALLGSEGLDEDLRTLWEAASREPASLSKKKRKGKAAPPPDPLTLLEHAWTLRVSDGDVLLASTARTLVLTPLLRSGGTPAQWLTYAGVQEDGQIVLLDADGKPAPAEAGPVLSQWLGLTGVAPHEGLLPEFASDGARKPPVRVLERLEGAAEGCTVLTGPLGSGKSWLCRFLRERLEQAGKRVVYLDLTSDANEDGVEGLWRLHEALHQAVPDGLSAEAVVDLSSRVPRLADRVERLLARAASSAGGELWLLVDGLGESSAEPAGQDVFWEMLPVRLPAGVRAVLFLEESLLSGRGRAWFEAATPVRAAWGPGVEEHDALVRRLRPGAAGRATLMLARIPELPSVRATGPTAVCDAIRKQRGEIAFEEGCLPAFLALSVSPVPFPERLLEEFLDGPAEEALKGCAAAVERTADGLRLRDPRLRRHLLTAYPDRAWSMVRRLEDRALGSSGPDAAGWWNLLVEAALDRCLAESAVPLPPDLAHRVPERMREPSPRILRLASRWHRALESSQPGTLETALVARRRGGLLLQAGDLGGSRAAVERAVAILSDLWERSPEPRVNRELVRTVRDRAEILRRQGLVQAALEDASWAADLLGTGGGEDVPPLERAEMDRCLGILLSEVRQPRRAQEHLESARREYLEAERLGGSLPERSLGSALEVLAALRLEAGDVDEALATCEEDLALLRGSRLAGGTGGVLTLRGRVHLSRGDRPAAEADWRQALAELESAIAAGHAHLRSERAALLHELGVLALDEGRTAEAEEFLSLSGRELLALVRTEGRRELELSAARALHDRALLLLRGGSHARALESFDQAADLLADPGPSKEAAARRLEHAVCLGNRAMCRCGLGDLPGALLDANEAVHGLGALQEDPRFPDCRAELAAACFNRAGLYRRGGERLRAMRDLDHAAALQDELLKDGLPEASVEDLAATLNQRAVLRGQAADGAQALEDFTRALRLLHDDSARKTEARVRALRATLLGNRAELHLRHGRPEAALPDLQAASEDFERLGPSGSRPLADTLFRHGRLLMESGETLRAEADFGRSGSLYRHLEAWPETVACSLALARCRETRGELPSAAETAADALETARTHLPGHPVVHDCALTAATLQLALGHAGQAAALTRQTLATEPSPEVRRSLLKIQAEALLAEHQPAEAVLAAREAASIPGESTSPSLRLVLGEALLESGAADQAHEILTAAVDDLARTIEESQRHDLLPLLARAWGVTARALEESGLGGQALQAVDWSIDLHQELVERQKLRRYAGELCAARIHRALLRWGSEAGVAVDLAEALRCFPGETVHPGLERILQRLEEQAEGSEDVEVAAAVTELLQARSGGPASARRREEELEELLAESEALLAAERPPEECLALYDRLAEAWETRPPGLRGSDRLRERLASAFNNRSVLRADRDDVPGALQDNLAACELYEENPGAARTTEQSMELARVLANRASLLEWVGQTSQALELLAQVCSLRRTLAAATGVPEHLGAYARSARQRARLLVEAGGGRPAREALDQAVLAFERLGMVDPQSTEELVGILLERAALWEEGEGLASQQYRLERLQGLREALGEHGAVHAAELGRLLARFSESAGRLGDPEAEAEAAAAALRLLEPLVEESGNEDLVRLVLGLSQKKAEPLPWSQSPQQLIEG